MMHWVRFVPSVTLLLGFIWLHFRMAKWLCSATPFENSLPRRRAVWVGFGLVAVFLSSGALLGIPRVVNALPSWSWIPWVRALAIAWAIGSMGVFLSALLWRRIPRFDPGRRHAVRVAGGTLLAVPFAATAFGVLVQRRDLRIREVSIPIPGLPVDLEGLRIVQVSDIHMGPFLDESDLTRAVDMANELHAHLAVVTGDLITGPGDPLDVCLRQLSRLRAGAGILGCLGNHEGYARVEDRTVREGSRYGIDFLRGGARPLRFGGAWLNVAGVDYQTIYRPYLEGAEHLQAPGVLNVLLSHNPDVFSVATVQGWDLTLAGHTHGGQVNVEIFNQSVNVARFYTPFVYGVYRQKGAAIYVTRGIGTVGIPARIGAPPEVALIRLTGASQRPALAERKI